VPRPQLRLVTADLPGDEGAGAGIAGRGGTAPKRDAEAERAAQRRAFAKELANARTDQKKAETDLERATKAERDGAAAVEKAEQAVAEAERRHAEAEAELSRLKLARRTAERAAIVARRRVGEVEAAVEALDDEAQGR
jgi:hypothetical protein